MSRAFRLTLIALVLSLTASLHADITLTLLGDPAAMTGAKFEADPKTKKLYTRVDVMAKHRVSVTVPGGKVIAFPAEAITIQSEEGWIDDVSLRGPYGGVPVKQAVAAIDAFLTTNKLDLSADGKKKWDEFKAAPKSSFRADIKLPPWAELSIECSIDSKGEKGSNEVKIYGDPDGVESDPLPVGAVKLPIERSVFSPDSKWVTDGREVIELATAKSIAKIAYPDKDKPSRYGYPALSADGKVLAVGTDTGKVHLVDTATWAVKTSLDIADTGAAKSVGVIGLSPAADLLYVKAAGIVRGVATADGAEKVRFDKPPFTDKGIALSHDGKLLAVSRDHAQIIALYNTADGKIAKTLDPQPLPAGVSPYGLAHAEALQFSPDDKTLYATGFMGARGIVWTVETGAFTIGLETQVAQMVSFSNDSKYAVLATWSTGWGANAVYLYDVKSGQTIGAARPLSNVFKGAAFSPDGQYVIAWRHNNPQSLLFKTADLAKAKPGPLPKVITPTTKKS